MSERVGGRLRMGEAPCVVQSSATQYKTRAALAAAESKLFPTYCSSLSRGYGSLYSYISLCLSLSFFYSSLRPSLLYKLIQFQLS